MPPRSPRPLRGIRARHSDPRKPAADDSQPCNPGTYRRVRSVMRRSSLVTRPGESRLSKYITHASGEIGATARSRWTARSLFSATQPWIS